MDVCPKCKNKTLVQEEFGMGIWERHVKCHTCGLLHVRGAVQDSIQRQVNPDAFERVMQKRIRHAVKFESGKGVVVIE